MIDNLLCSFRLAWAAFPDLFKLHPVAAALIRLANERTTRDASSWQRRRFPEVDFRRPELQSREWRPTPCCAPDGAKKHELTRETADLDKENVTSEQSFGTRQLPGQPASPPRSVAAQDRQDEVLADVARR